VAERVLETGEPLLTASATEDPLLRGSRSVLDLGLRSILCVPVRGPSGVTGALYLDHRFTAGHFVDDDLEIVQALADIIGVSLEKARLHRELAERAEALARSHEAVSRENDRRSAEIARLADALSRASPGAPVAEGGIVGSSPKLARALDVARRVAPSDLPVLVLGESGTGKELVARYVHERSLRARGPFVAINCAALPESLLESELFGHVRGAFTGATRDHAGLFRTAEGGTLLLDEIGEMPLRMQTRLLRVLQEGEVQPVGGASPVRVDVRVIAATNRDLEREAEEGRFRRDLYFRLFGARIELPALRERREDLGLLCEAILTRVAREPGMRRARLSREALGRMLSYDWPGNVRELEQALRRAVLISEGEEILPEDLGLAGGGATRRESLRRFDRALVEEALRAARGNRTSAARALGVSRVTLHRWIRRHELG
jgi:transcriptional regulator with GAF, ATPase, and Fis domain